MCVCSVWYVRCTRFYKPTGAVLLLLAETPESALLSVPIPEDQKNMCAFVSSIECGECACARAVIYHASQMRVPL